MAFGSESKESPITTSDNHESPARVLPLESKSLYNILTTPRSMRQNDEYSSISTTDFVPVNSDDYREVAIEPIDDLVVD